MPSVVGLSLTLHMPSAIMWLHNLGRHDRSETSLQCDRGRSDQGGPFSAPLRPPQEDYGCQIQASVNIGTNHTVYHRAYAWFSYTSSCPSQIFLQISLAAYTFGKKAQPRNTGMARRGKKTSDCRIEPPTPEMLLRPRLPSVMPKNICVSG